MKHIFLALVVCATLNGCLEKSEEGEIYNCTKGQVSDVECVKCWSAYGVAVSCNWERSK